MTDIFHPDLTPRLRAFADKEPADLSPTDYEALGAPFGPPEEWDLEITAREIPGPDTPVPVRIYRPQGESAHRPCLVWLHGGAWVAGELDWPEGHETARGIAGRADAVVVSVDYRLCGEQVHFPAPHDDTLAAYRWVREHAADLGVDPDRIALGGASAGGNLAAGAALRLRDGGEQAWRTLLLYPMLHLPLPNLSEELAAALAQLPAAMQPTEEQRARLPEAPPVVAFLGGGLDRITPYAFPGLAPDLRGFPPTYLENAEFDPLRASGERFAEQLGEAGVPVEQVTTAGVLHGHLNIVGFDAAHATLDRMAAWLRKE